MGSPAGFAQWFAERCIRIQNGLKIFLRELLLLHIAFRVETEPYLMKPFACLVSFVFGILMFNCDSRAESTASLTLCPKSKTESTSDAKQCTNPQMSRIWSWPTELFQMQMNSTLAPPDAHYCELTILSRPRR